MTHHSRSGPVGNVAIRNGLRLVESGREITETRTEHNRRVGHLFQALAQPARCLVNGVVVRINHISTAAIDALINVAMKPASNAREPSRARSLRLVGAMAPMPPS